MGKVSNKARYTQLKEWLSTLSKSSNPKANSKSFSKADHYNKNNAR